MATKIYKMAESPSLSATDFFLNFFLVSKTSLKISRPINFKSLCFWWILKINNIIRRLLDILCVCRLYFLAINRKIIVLCAALIVVRLI